MCYSSFLFLKSLIMKIESIAWSDSTEIDDCFRSPDLELIHRGPVHELISRANLKVRVEVFYCCMELEAVNLLISASTKEGEGLGFCVGTILGDEGALSYSGYLEVRNEVRGLAYASMINDVLVGELQCFANSCQRPLIWKVTDANHTFVTDCEFAHEGDFTHPAVISAHEERARWVYLYGEDGKYGIRDGMRVFVPV
jgi:hypothetical protein